jgi:hypothetical protein
MEVNRRLKNNAKSTNEPRTNDRPRRQQGSKTAKRNKTCSVEKHHKEAEYGTLCVASGTSSLAKHSLQTARHTLANHT